MWAAKTGALISNTVADADAVSSIQTGEVRNYQLDLLAGGGSEVAFHTDYLPSTQRVSVDIEIHQGDRNGKATG